MGSVYEARRQNARRIGEKIQDYLAHGFLVLDDEGSPVENISLTGFSRNFGLSVNWKSDNGNNVSIVYFDDNIELDNGIHTPIREFNAKFAKWRILDPKDLKPLV